MFNRTKIVATIGPASNTKETIIALINEGVDVFRLNFSHGTHEEHGSVIQLIQEINEEFKIDTRDLLEGIYYVRVAFKSGTMPYSRKVIIMHKE